MSIATELAALDTQRDNLAANLVTKGVSASSSETLAQLVPKVLNITQGGGGDPFVPDYGDGSLNSVANGYGANILINNEEAWYNNESYSGGNFRGLDQWWKGLINAKFGPLVERSINIGELINIGDHPINATITKIIAGLRVYAFNASVTAESTICIYTRGYALSSNSTFTAFKLVIDGNKYTLQEAVAAGLIKPLVLISSHYTANSTHYFASILNIYTGGSTGGGTYCDACVLFMTVPGHSYTGIEFNASANYSVTYDDGLRVSRCNLPDLTVSIKPV